ncbi:MAG: type II toxin-antitoxin system RelE/ParE family toxin [Methanosarcinales archaeon]
MTYSIYFYKKAAKQWKHFDKKTQKALKSKQRAKADIRLLKDYRNPPLWRLRIGKFRAVYEVDYENKRVIILLIEKKETVYKSLKQIRDN